MLESQSGRKDTMGTRATISWEEFLAAGKEDQRWEWVDGEIQFMSPVNLRHERVLAALIAYLFEYSRAHAGWICFASNCIFTMSSGNWRMTDASLVRADRFTGILPTKADFPPDVAFEILSPGNPASEVHSRRQDYLESGVTQVWIDIAHRSVELIGTDRRSRFFKEDQNLVIDELPGFALELRTLFAL
jgi:Uma2 family endonuclease